MANRDTKEMEYILEEWLHDDNLALIQGWVRDGYTIKDIARRIGVGPSTIYRWRSEYQEFDEAFRRGGEMVDYLVENALLKTALGYQTKEVKVTTTMRYGKVVETVKETLEKEQAPNVTAIQMWLYNRERDKWKNMNSSKNVFEDMEEDTSIEITVKRAEKDETGSREKEGIETTAPDMNRELVIRKRSKAEANAERERRNKAKAEAARDTQIIGDEDDEYDGYSYDGEEE